MADDAGLKPDVIRETDAASIRLAKTLIRSARYGALAVLDPATGVPLASRVAVATDADSAPLILVSSLSAHTGALLADPRCSLLLGEPGKGDPLAHPRITLVCRALKLERGTPEQIRAERRYLARQPKAKLYAGFGDFAFFRLDPERASLNGGFGKAYLLGRADVMTQGSAVEALALTEEGAVAHMNGDHSDAIQLFAAHFGGAAEGDGPWRLTGLDAEGMDLAWGDAVLRVVYPEPLAEAADLRKVLAAMAREARGVK